MILIALAAAAAATLPAQCTGATNRVIIRQCEAAASVAAGNYGKAADAFELAAREAETVRDPASSGLWLQAGNAALAANDHQRALPFLNAAIARGNLAGEELGEAYLDRARAYAGLGKLVEARADLDQATRLVPADPLGWLLSATLSRRLNDLGRARSDIQRAAELAPDDSGVALEAGNIAILSGNEAAARTAWQAAVRLQPDSPSAKAAQDNLARLQ